MQLWHRMDGNHHGLAELALLHRIMLWNPLSKFLWWRERPSWELRPDVPLPTRIFWDSRSHSRGGGAVSHRELLPSFMPARFLGR